MIDCLPRSLCSWDFTASGLSCGTAILEYDWITDQGRILTPRIGYDIRKHGVFSGRWTFEQSGHVVADAQKPSAMFRTFEISTEGVHLTLQAESAFQRVFEVLIDQQIVGRIAPIHAFTRRATIQCADVIPENIQLFAFWLVGLTWRRSARNNSGAAS